VIPGNAAATFGLAWVTATGALALHVADEATHDFLAWYNPSALRFRRLLGGLPFPPTFTFVPWLLGLLAAVVVLAALTPVAYRGTAWLRPLAYVLAAEHVGNGLLHLVGSVFVGRRVPGVLSAPVLVLTGGWLAYVVAHTA
jgi:hypothetical protein